MSSFKPVVEFQKWFAEIGKKRIQNAGVSVADFRFASCRIRRVKGDNTFIDVSTKDITTLDCESRSGGVIYWMNRDQRVQGANNRL